MLDSRAAMLAAIPLAHDEVELIPHRPMNKAVFELLRAYHIREWHDELGRWHVVLPSSRISEIESAAKAHRSK